MKNISLLILGSLCLFTVSCGAPPCTKGKTHDYGKWSPMLMNGREAYNDMGNQWLSRECENCGWKQTKLN